MGENLSLYISLVENEIIYSLLSVAKIQSTPSDWKRVTGGIPQGSVLGPVSLVIYINDLLDCLITSPRTSLGLQMIPRSTDLSHKNLTLNLSTLHRHKFEATRGHNLKTFVQQATSNIRRNFYVCWDLESPSFLCHSVVNVSSVKSFEAKLGNCWSDLSVKYDFQAQLDFKEFIKALNITNESQTKKESWVEG